WEARFVRLRRASFPQPVAARRLAFDLDCERRSRMKRERKPVERGRGSLAQFEFEFVKRLARVAGLDGARVERDLDGGSLKLHDALGPDDVSDHDRPELLVDLRRQGLGDRRAGGEAEVRLLLLDRPFPFAARLHGARVSVRLDGLNPFLAGATYSQTQS